MRCITVRCPLHTPPISPSRAPPPWSSRRMHGSPLRFGWVAWMSQSGSAHVPAHAWHRWTSHRRSHSRAPPHLCSGTRSFQAQGCPPWAARAWACLGRACEEGGALGRGECLMLAEGACWSRRSRLARHGAGVPAAAHPQHSAICAWAPLARSAAATRAAASHLSRVGISRCAGLHARSGRWVPPAALRHACGTWKASPRCANDAASVAAWCVQLQGARAAAARRAVAGGAPRHPWRLRRLPLGTHVH